MTMIATIELNDTHLHQLRAGNPVLVHGEYASLDGEQMTRYVVTIDGQDDLQRLPVTLHRYDLDSSNPAGLSIRLDADRVGFLAEPRGGAKDVGLFRDGKPAGHTVWLLGPRWNERP